MKSTLINIIIIAAVIIYLLYSGKYQVFVGAIKHKIAPAQSRSMEWLDRYDEAVFAAQSDKRPLFVLITAPDWCMPCQALEQTTLQNEKLLSLLGRRFVTLRISDTNPDRGRFHFKSYPTIIVMDHEKHELLRFSGFVAASELVRGIGKIGLN